VPQDFLQRIVARKRAEIAVLRSDPATRAWPERAHAAPAPPSFEAALRRPGRMRLIAEIKRASPSAGVLRHIPEPAALARTYSEAGADAISVLTDRDFFGGSIDDLRAVRAAAETPLLRKDFVLDPLQVYEAKLAGAAAVLLIAECLAPAELTRLVELVVALAMTPLVELFDAENLPAVLDSGARVVGVNNRDLKTFEVDVEHSLRLRARVPSDRVFVAESGVKSAAEVARLRAAGVHAVLVGESLLRAGDPAAAVRELLKE
jgi:indole-3-glycerol phosphate synthase